MSIEDICVVADLTLDYLTHGFTLSYSSLRLYKISKEDIVLKIEELQEFNFPELINWLAKNKNEWFLGRYKATRKFVYAMNDYICNGIFTSDDYVYFDSKIPYRFLDLENIGLLEEFCSYKGYTGNYALTAKNQVAPLLLFFQKLNKGFEDIDYDKLYAFYLEEATRHQSKGNFNDVLGKMAGFLSYCYEAGLVDNPTLSFLMNVQNIKYFEALLNNKENIGLSIQSFDSGNSMPDDIVQSIIDFQNLLLSKGYPNKTVSLAKRAIQMYHVFSLYFSVGINHKIADFWANDVISAYSKGYKEYRRIIHAYYDYLCTGNFQTEKLYIQETDYERLMPKWAKPFVDKYLNYRIRLGFNHSTLSEDKNSILRFVLYLDANGIGKFEDISFANILGFQTSDSHKTLEGKNAYMVRIKNFLAFLYDEGVIKLRFNSCIAEGYRIPQKIVEVIPDDELNYIYENIDKFETGTELRNICIFLLGVRMGIRSTDIVNLRFENISFKNMTVSFVQSKTKKEITLPMPVMVANSIYKYVKNGRPKLDSEYIFIKAKFPHNQYSRSVCLKSAKSVYRKLGLEYKHSGFHITRKTYATSILKNTHDISKASCSLGHSDNKTVDDYIVLDSKLMKKCGLSLEDIKFGGSL